MLRSGRGFLILAALSLVLGFVGRAPGGTQVLGGPAGIDEAGPGTPLASAVPTAKGSLGGPSREGGARPSQTAALACAAGRNGGRTDRGVTASSIRLAATVVLDGPAASLLKHSPTGMKAVLDKVNARGGICGRRLQLNLVNDSFDARLGQQFIRNFANEDYFALAVVPSAEGLSAAIASREISRAGIPVVGTDGMRIEQYKEPWVWPVATATVSTMRIMAEYGFRERGARTFAIVWDGKYKFGVEGAQAFRKQVAALGGRVVADVKLDPDQPSYSSEVAAFNGRCGGGKCDMVALLLLPDTAKNWLERFPAMGKIYTSGAQTLFTDEFARSCVKAANERCHGLAVWTGYAPAIGRHAGLPDVEAYVDDVGTVSPGIDVRNQFLQGAYLGMSVLVDALKKVGPNLTRARLRAVLDSMSYKTDLASSLSWRPGRHTANVRARSFSIVASQGAFNGWRDENTGWVVDPTAGG